MNLHQATGRLAVQNRRVALGNRARARGGLHGRNHRHTKYDERTLGVPLVQLRPRKVDAATNGAIEDWHYWMAMGYQY